MTIFPGTLHGGFPVNGTSGFDKLCGRAVYSFQSCVAPSKVMSSIAKSCRSLRSRQVIPTSSQCRREVSIIKSIVLPFSLRFIATKCASNAFFRHDTVFLNTLKFISITAIPRETGNSLLSSQLSSQLSLPRKPINLSVSKRHSSHDGHHT